MLRVARLTDRTGRYYLADLGAEVTAVELAAARSDGRRSDGRPPPPGASPAGRWVGAGAARLGLDGPVTAPPLEAVLAGRSPVTGGPLRWRETEVSGFDLTFAAPKSVSVAFGLGDAALAASVLEAHRTAVDAALGYVAHRAVSVRRGTGEERSVEPIEGLIAASFTHGASRALDPHLHSHVVVANLAQGPDGRWSAIDGRGIRAHAAAIGALYDTQLRHELTTGLGVEWSARRSGAYEWAAIDPVVVGAFSSRRADINGYLFERGWFGSTGGPETVGVPAGAPSPRRSTVAWAATREAKASPIDPGELRARWATRAASVGVTAASLGHALEGRGIPGSGGVGVGSMGGGPVRADALDEYRFAAILNRSADAVLTRRHAVAAWAGAVGAGARVASVEQCVDMLASWGTGVGVSESTCRMADLVPAPHVVRALGPRPCEPVQLDAWRAAAATIDRYRARWPLASPEQPLGCDAMPATLSRMPAARLAEHLSAERAIADMRRSLGRAVERDGQGQNRSLGR